MKAIEIIQEKIKSIIAADNTEGKIINAISFLGITVEDEGSESIEERVDAMLSEFNLASKIVDWKELENAFKLFKEFNLNIKEQSDDEFLDSIEIINLILKIHHYQDIGYVTAK